MLTFFSTRYAKYYSMVAILYFKEIPDLSLPEEEQCILWDQLFRRLSHLSFWFRNLVLF